MGEVRTRATQEIVDFICRADIENFPSEVLHIGKRCLLDGLGLILAGSTDDCCRILRKRIQAVSGKSEATLLGEGTLMAPAFLAAQVNGTAGHAMDYDDTQVSRSPDRIYGLLMHPTIPALSSSLAVAEKISASGKKFLEAFLTGFEISCKMAEAIHPSHYKKGFQTSATIGAFAAAACSAKLLNLNREGVAIALGIAASLCGGFRINFGTMSKPLQVGRACENGIVAAELASLGFTANPEALDGPWGFFQIFGGGFEPEKIENCVGNPHTIIDPGISIKPYPCGVLGHPSMDAMMRVVVDHDLQPERIRAIKLRAGSNILNPLRFKVARTALEGKFSLPFMLASIAVQRKAGIKEFTDEFVGREDVQRMMARVETILDPEIEAKGTDKMRSVVEVFLEDGRHIVQPADERYRGGPERPFSREELLGKFRECAERVLSEEKIRQAVGLIESIERVENINELIGAISPCA